MRLRTKFAVAVLGLSLLAGYGVKRWADQTYGEGVAAEMIAEGSKQVRDDRMYAKTVRDNMTPERHELYLQMQRSVGVAPDGATTCFTIPAAANDADAKALTNIIRAQDKIMGGTASFINRGTPAKFCKFGAGR